MSAFNDYCVVCDQLIPESPEPIRSACTDKKHPCCLIRVLYCSEECRQKDEHLIHSKLEALESSNSDSSQGMDDPESLIKSPLLIPIDHCQKGSENGRGSGSYCLMNMASSSTISIPRLSLQPSISNSAVSYDSINLDHIAEKNYQLWLNQHH